MRTELHLPNVAELPGSHERMDGMMLTIFDHRHCLGEHAAHITLNERLPPSEKQQH
jgi:hypothetical protein